MLRISGGYLAVIADWLRDVGQGHSATAARVRRLRADESLPPEDAERLLAEAAALTGDPLAALRIGQRVRWPHLGALGHMLAGTRTLEELLNGYVFYESLFYGVNIANLRRDADGVTLFWAAGDAYPHFALFSISSVVTVMRATGVDAQDVAAVLLPAGRGVDASTCSAILGSNELQWGDALGVRVSRAALGRGLRHGGSDADRALRQAAAFPELDDGELAAELYAAIAAALPHRDACLPVIAERLALSPRTLQRRLAAIPDGLRGAIGRVRMQLATEYLQDPSLKLIAVSMLLGYAEQSAFQLAFRRHHGCAPGQWRRSRHAAGPV